MARANTNQAKVYGADIDSRGMFRLAIALCLGTVIEWLDFTVYCQLGNVITALFFPPSNPTAAELGFWAVYAVGFTARPVGSLIFGTIGDAYGRRISLMISVLLVTLPTLLIGCLPTYAMIGIAAPILMALLRFVQGIALGGEFGSAITYLYEVAPVGSKGFVSSLGQVASCPGMILGILLCQAVLYGCTQDQLMLWGWRVPFLVTFCTPPLALYLRLHMPEPHEFLQDRQAMVMQRVAGAAATRVARSFTCRQASLTAAKSSVKQQQQQQQQTVDTVQQAEQLEMGSLEVGQEFTQEVQHLSTTIKHHIPLAVLFREHWAGVLLQFLLQGSYGTVFYTFFTYIPSYMSKHLHTSASDTLWAVVIGLVLFAACCAAAGHWVGDGEVSNAWVLLTLSTIDGAVILPVMLATERAPALALWLLLPLMFALTGVYGGVMTSVGPAIYPAAVRASGYNLAYSLAMSVFAGLNPLLISALAVAIHPATLAAGVVVLATCVLSLVAAAVVMRVRPGTNVPCPAGQQQYLQEQEHKRQEATQMQRVVVVNAG